MKSNSPLPRQRQKSIFPSFSWMAVILFLSGPFFPVTAAAPDLVPFIAKLTTEKLPRPLDYMGTNNPVDMDYPYCPVMIEGEFWIMYKNGYRGPVYRYKGTNIEEAVRQPDGAAQFPLRAPYILGGMWYDQESKRLYAPLHCEMACDGAPMVLREIHLASSGDKGLTWKYEGPILTRDEPGKPRAGKEFSGLSWDGGDGDHVIYVDEKGGFIYLFSNHYTWRKKNSKAAEMLRHHVARCAIGDKMAPGKWKKFYQGKWSEPGLGGKASFVNGYCVNYNSYLKKYVSFNYQSSISVCDDLSRQGWSPSFPCGRSWGIDGRYGMWALNENKTDTRSSGQTLFIYTFWQKLEGLRVRLELSRGQMVSSNGVVSSSLWLSKPYFAPYITTLDPSPFYAYTPLFESADPIEARRTRRVGCTDGENHYSGSWADAADPDCYEGRAKTTATAGDSVEFTFYGSDIYWRAAKGPDLGQAEVYLDGSRQATVDCWANVPAMFQFAFIKRGLRPGRHTIKVLVKGEKNYRSTGTGIKHMLFEHGAEAYRASDCFSSIKGKNQWCNEQRQNDSYTEMIFQDSVWRGGTNTEVSFFQMRAGSGDAVRKWMAPHSGWIRIEGRVSDSGQERGLEATLLRNANEIWSARGMKFGQPVSHDVTIKVAQGDELRFIVSRGSASANVQATWDPTITYVNQPQAAGRLKQ